MPFVDSCRKLKQQTDKLLKLASSGPKSMALSEGGGDNDDPLNFRPHPEVMALWGKEADGTGGCFFMIF